MQFGGVSLLLLCTLTVAMDTVADLPFMKIGECMGPTITEPGVYKGLYLKRGYLCNAQILAPLGYSIKLSLKNLAMCQKNPTKVMIRDGETFTILECDDQKNRFVSHTNSISLKYNPRHITYMSIEFEKNAIHCNESIGFHKLDKSLILEHQGEAECAVVLPGRARVVIEDLKLQENNCHSHLEFRTGPQVNKMKFEARRKMCSDENGPQEEPITISCNKGILYFNSASSKPESVTFRVEIIDDISRLVLSHYKCFE